MVAAVTGFPSRIGRRPHGGPTPSRRYERRRPEKTPLHKVVSENLASWLAWCDRKEQPVPGYVEEELRGYLECGLLCFGFARAVCMTCRTGFVVAFHDQGRDLLADSFSRWRHAARADPEDTPARTNGASDRGMGRRRPRHPTHNPAGTFPRGATRGPRFSPRLSRPLL